MSAGKFATLFLAIALCGVGAQGTARENGTLSTLVAGLQRLQDQVAAGDLAAFKAQPAALKSIAAAIEASSSDVWKDNAERNAAVIYLLSGGSARPVARQLSGGVLSKEDGALLRAALAYASGRREDAKTLLERFDPRKMDLRLAGQLAYAQAELASQRNAAQALEAFDLARLLSPGGLVEEAALRREIRILGATNDIDRFCFLSDQYIRRFPRSIYYDSFKQRLASSLERMALGTDFAKIEKYVALAAALPAGDRRHALLTLARAAALSAHAQAATVFAHAVRQDAAAQGEDRARARLYSDAARILTGDNAQAATDLETLPAERLDRKDGALLVAARQVARAIAWEAPIPQSPNEPAEDSPTIRSAEEALQRAASLVSQEGGNAR